MISLQSYRQQIGYFNQVYSNRNVLGKKSAQKSLVTRSKNLHYIDICIRSFKLILICTLAITIHQLNAANIRSNVSLSSKEASCNNETRFMTLTKLRPNKYAKITYGNKATMRSGLRNFHLNIRSIGNKMADVKQLVSQHKPHIFGLSECELTSTNNTHLKIPGYDLLYPKSWSLQGYARVIVYIKSSLDYQQMHDFEDDFMYMDKSWFPKW